METMELHTIGVNLGKTVLEHMRQGYSHDTGRLLTEARAIPPLMSGVLISGVMINSSTVTSESSR